MKVLGNFVVISKSKFTSNTSNNTYYSLDVVGSTTEPVTRVNCTEEVYDQVTGFKQYDFEADVTYNAQYRQTRCIVNHVVSAK